MSPTILSPTLTHTHTPHTTASTDDAPDPHPLPRRPPERHRLSSRRRHLRVRTGPRAWPTRRVRHRTDRRARGAHEQPEGHSFEDPRYLGVHDDCLAFICADGVEYFTKYGDHSIYQAALHIDPATWTLRDFWRLQARASVATRRTGCPSARSRPTVPAPPALAPKPASPHGRPRRADGGVGSR